MVVNNVRCDSARHVAAGIKEDPRCLESMRVMKVLPRVLARVCKAQLTVAFQCFAEGLLLLQSHRVEQQRQQQQWKKFPTSVFGELGVLFPPDSSTPRSSSSSSGSGHSTHEIIEDATASVVGSATGTNVFFMRKYDS